MKRNTCLILLLLFISSFPTWAAFGQMETKGIKNPDTLAALQTDLEKNNNLFEVTFFVNMTPAADFHPQVDTVYLTGNWIGWSEPGDLIEEQMFIRVENTNLWTKTYQLEEGEYHYKYFLNAGWFGGEYPGEPNRQITVNNDMTVYNVWGSHLDLDPEEYFAGGFGTQADPWLISLPSHLDNIRYFLGPENADKHFKIIDNISLDEEPWNQGSGWEPIGGLSNGLTFSGTIDGNDNTISNLFIHEESEQFAGLFGINDGTIIGLVIQEANVAGGGPATGILAGYNRQGNISNCYAAGDIMATNLWGVAGGLVGLNQSSILGSGSQVNLEGKGNSAGGLVGTNESGQISSSFSAGTVSGVRHSGGLVGLQLNGGQIINSYSVAQVTGWRHTGGLVGFLRRGTVSHSFSAGLVRGVQDSGGLTGGYSGIDLNAVSGCFWNNQTSGQDDSSVGTAGSIAQMTQQETFTGWDFAQTWTIDQGNSFPYLQWETLPAQHHTPLPARKVVFEITNEQNQDLDFAEINLGGHKQNKGDYVFAVLPGTYSWNISLPGYQPQSGSITLSDQDASLSIIMTPFPAGSLTDIDGNTYETITIGEQEWMAENLRVTKFKSGEPIPAGTVANYTDPSLGYYYIYGDNPENLPDYGLLYSGRLVKDARGLCPSGWTVPSDHQWAVLETELGLPQKEAFLAPTNTGTTEGGKLKAAGTEHWFTPNVGATDAVNFGALPAGYLGNNYNGKGSRAYFFLNSFSSPNALLYKSLDFNHSKILRGSIWENTAASIRCVKIAEGSSLPAVSTNTIFANQYNEFIITGTITDNGNTPIKGKGFVIDIFENPELTVSETSLHLFVEGGDEHFIAKLQGLNLSIPHYVRAFAINAQGISYGEQVSFTPATSGLPSLSNLSPNNLQPTSVNLTGTIYNIGGASILARGLLWSNAPNPTFSDNVIDAENAEGELSITLRGLTPDKIYYVRAFVTMAAGTVFSNQVRIQTPDNKILPEVSVKKITNSGATQVVIESNVAATGNLDILDRGIQITDNSGTYSYSASAGNGEGDFSVEVSGLEPNTIFFASAYAANENGRAYSPIVMFRSGFETLEQANESLDDMYIIMYQYFQQPFDNFGVKSFDLSIDLMGDDMVLDAFSTLPFVSHYRYQAHRNKNSSLISNTWNRFHRLINEANHLLKYLEEATGEAAEKDRIKGEALAMRAYAHFKLVEVFSHTYDFNPEARGVPYVTHPLTDQKTPERKPSQDDKLYLGHYQQLPVMPYHSVAETFQFINEDLEEAIQMLEGAGAQTHRSRIDLAVAMGIKARVALVMCNWAEAKNFAAEAITLAESHGKSLFTPDTYSASSFNSVDASEWMWGSEIDDETSTQYHSFFSHMDASSYGYAANGLPKLISANLYQTFSASDIRRNLFIGPGQGSGLLGDYIQTKFMFPSTSSWAADYLYMRLSELYLIQAEALARIGQYGQAQQILFQLVNQRDSTYTQSEATGEELIEEILLHRRKELWGEGHRHTDLRRLQQPLSRPSGPGNHNPSYAMVMEVEANDEFLLWEMPYYNTLDIIKNGNGSIFLNGQSVDQHMLVLNNTKISLEAFPDANWQFLRWTVDEEVIGTEPLLEYTMPFSDITIKAEFLNLTSIHEVTADNLKVYPNPARYEIWVDFFNPENKRVNLLLTNLQGQIVDHKVVEEAGRVNATFNVSGLQPGVYLMIVRNQKMNKVRKIVIQN